MRRWLMPLGGMVITSAGIVAPACAQNTAGPGGAGGNAKVIIVNRGGVINLSNSGGGGGDGGNATGGPKGDVPVPSATGASIWTHNNSTVLLKASGAGRRIFYDVPRAGMIGAGARPGSLLFTGTRNGNAFGGTAYIFAGTCGTFPYPVSGAVSGERAIALSGRAPIVDRSTCAVTGYKLDRLLFSYVSSR